MNPKNFIFLVLMVFCISYFCICEDGEVGYKPSIVISPGSEKVINFQVDDPSIYSITKLISLHSLKASEIEPFIRSRLSDFGQFR